MSVDVALAKGHAAGTRNRTERPRITVIAGTAYLLILLCVWGPFATTSGMGWETYFTVASESSRGWRNFLYLPDPLRIHVANFYELAYLLGDFIGIRGSFVPYQLLYAALWWARSVLAFLIIRRLAPNSTVLPFSIGALMLVHAPDVLIGWVGQLHQFGYFLWLLISLYLLIVALQQASVIRAGIYAVVAWLFEYMCLWTYEGPLFIVVAAPFLFAFLLRLQPEKRVAMVVSAWYVPPAVYCYLTYQRYMHLEPSGYQQSLLRKSFRPLDILSDWVFNVRYSLSFWSWQPIESHIQQGHVFALATGAVLVFVLAGIIVSRREDPSWVPSLHDRRVWYILAAGFIFLALSFPAQLLLAAAREPRRTQLLSAIAAAIVLGAAISIAAGLIRRERVRPLFAIALAVPIMWFGACRTIERQGSHRWEWDVHLTAMRQILRTAPRVQDGTIVVMTNIQKTTDPFSSYNFWFNNALRLAYPRTAVAGVYYYDDNTAGPVDNLRLQGDRWEFTGKGAIPLIRSARIDQTLVIAYDRSGIAKVLPEIPSFVCAGECAGQLYKPYTRILHESPAAEALRRYGPL